MRFTDEEYAILTIEAELLERDEDKEKLCNLVEFNFASINIKNSRNMNLNFAELKNIFTSNNINIECNLKNLQNMPILSRNQSYSLTLDYEMIQPNLCFRDNKDLSFINLPLNLSRDYDKDKIEKFIICNQHVIIFDPFFYQNEIAIDKYANFLEWIFKMPYENIRLSNNHIHVNSLRQHPCHIGACSAKECHMKKTGLPKNIYLKFDYGIYIFSDCNIGNLKYDNLKDLLHDSQENYLNINGKIFTEEILNYPYEFFPWKEYFIKYWRAEYA